MLYFLLSALLPLAAAIFDKRPQAVAVNGTLLCNGKYYEHARIRIYDGNLALPDKFLVEVRSLANGTFFASATEEAYFTIKPKLNIYHNCNDETKEGWRKIEIRIPADHVTDGSTTNVFQAGVLNINAHYPGETRDYLN